MPNLLIVTSLNSSTALQAYSRIKQRLPRTIHDLDPTSTMAEIGIVLEQLPIVAGTDADALFFKES